MVPFVQFKCKLGQSYVVANALAGEIASRSFHRRRLALLVKLYRNDTDISHFARRCR